MTIFINYIYNHIYIYSRSSDCEELSLSSGGIERPSHGFELNSQTHYRFLVIFSGLLDLNFELRNRLNKSPGNNIVNPVLRLVVFARNPIMGGPTKNPINEIKERNAT